MNSNISSRNSKNELIDNYIDAIKNILTMQNATFIAENYEKGIVSNLNSLGARNGVYLTKDDIPVDMGEQFVKDSVNAHLSKVQSEQIKYATVAEVNDIKIKTLDKFKGKKITITKISSDLDIFDAVYVDLKTGEYRVSSYKSKTVKGNIEDIIFENNLLVVKPSFMSRKLVPNRLLIHVYVLDIQTLQPNIIIQ